MHLFREFDIKTKVQEIQLSPRSAGPDDYLKLDTGKVSTKVGRRTFAYAGPRLWDSLPLNLRTEEDNVKYKGQLKILLFTDTERIKRKVFQYD